ncbi:Cupin RmlC-type [Neofusicoccum parvum]|nr:Cupin RmlC-type [Neofusicoccum parvum]
MATSGKIQDVDSPPGSSTSYVVSLFRGEKLVIPCSNSVMRLLVTGKETNMTFAVVSTGGSASDPIGFHYHREAHDVFLCLKGQVNVWANDTARTLSAGDFASVPPGVVHQYQILGDHSEFVGLIVPGGWEEFFRIVGEPYRGPLFPVDDARDPRVVLIPRLIEASERCDMVPARDHPGAAVQPWAPGRDDALPAGVRPYFLRAGAGPKWVVEGTVCRPLATTVQSAGRFSVASLEGGDVHRNFLAGIGRLRWESVHHCFVVVHGKVAFRVGGEAASLAADDSIFIPAAEGFSFSFASAFAQMYVFANGGGVAELVMKVGRQMEAPGSIPEKPMTEWRAAQLAELGHEHGFAVEQE